MQVLKIPKGRDQIVKKPEGKTAMRTAKRMRSALQAMRLVVGVLKAVVRLTIVQIINRIINQCGSAGGCISKGL